MLDAHLREHPWLIGDALIVAEFSVAVTLPYADQAHLPLYEFAHVQRWHTQLCALDGWREPFPARASNP